MLCAAAGFAMNAPTPRSCVGHCVYKLVRIPDYYVHYCGRLVSMADLECAPRARHRRHARERVQLVSYI
jgi:hypothetical protein